MAHGAPRKSAYALAFALAMPLCAFADPGDTLQAAGVLVDNNGFNYPFTITAIQHGAGGGGDVDINIPGPSPSRACSVHGPNADEGSFPYQGIQCGVAFGNSVSINGCVANLEAHGYAHSDHPNVNYLGSATIEVRYEKTRGGGDPMKVTIYTPKENIQLIGKVAGAAAVMPSCTR
jgi:hypothetical protein